LISYIRAIWCFSFSRNHSRVYHETPPSRTRRQESSSLSLPPSLPPPFLSLDKMDRYYGDYGKRYRFFDKDVSRRNAFSRVFTRDHDNVVYETHARVLANESRVSGSRGFVSATRVKLARSGNRGRRDPSVILSVFSRIRFLSFNERVSERLAEPRRSRDRLHVIDSIRCESGDSKAKTKERLAENERLSGKS